MVSLSEFRISNEKLGDFYIEVNFKEKNMCIVIRILSIIIILGFILVIVKRPDEVQPINNSDGQIICGYTNKPCIKDTLYTYCDNCSDCPYHKE